MLKPTSDMVLQSLAEALEVTAFVCLDMPTDEMVPPPNANLLVLPFGNTPKSELQLAAPEEFGRLLAANILALEPNDPEVLQRALDAVKEICNITTGTLLRRMCESPTEMPEVGLPQATKLDGERAWKEFAGQEGTTVVMAEGMPIAVRVKENA